MRHYKNDLERHAPKYIVYYALKLGSPRIRPHHSFLSVAVLLQRNKDVARGSSSGCVLFVWGLGALVLLKMEDMYDS